MFYEYPYFFILIQLPIKYDTYRFTIIAIEALVRIVFSLRLIHALTRLCKKELRLTSIYRYVVHRRKSVYIRHVEELE